MNKYDDLCFILSCHDKETELLAHLDILSFCHIPHSIIVVHSGTRNIRHFLEPAIDYIHIDPKGRSLGALLALTRGIRIARDKGYHYVCYRNGDDWIFNHSRAELFLHAMKKGFVLLGYNWFGSGGYDDYALNDLCLDLNAISKLDLDEWDNEFIKNKRTECERLFAKMINSVVTDHGKILKLSDREHIHGIGRLFNRRTYQNNNRWFNLTWQLISDHDDGERRKHWEILKPLIPYADTLIRKNLFMAWLNKVPPEHIPLTKMTTIPII